MANLPDPSIPWTFEGSPPEAVFILSGGIVRVTGNGGERFRSTSYRDFDVHGLCTAGKTRVVAAAELSRRYPGTYFVTTSRVESDFPSHAEVMSTELHRLGVPMDRIVLEERSINTITELAEMPKLAQQFGWRSVGILTNLYHFPRIRLLLDQLPTIVPDSDAEFHDSWNAFSAVGSISLVPAEPILRCRSPRYAKLIEVAERTQAFAGRLEAEERGCRQILDGSYVHRFV